MFNDYTKKYCDAKFAPVNVMILQWAIEIVVLYHVLTTIEISANIRNMLKTKA